MDISVATGTNRSSGNHQQDVAAVGEDDGDAEPMGRPGSGSSVETKETTARRILNILPGAGEDSGREIDDMHGDGGVGSPRSSSRARGRMRGGVRC